MTILPACFCADTMWPLPWGAAAHHSAPCLAFLSLWSTHSPTCGSTPSQQLSFLFFSDLGSQPSLSQKLSEV